MKELSPPERRRQPTDAEGEYIRQVRRFFAFGRVVLTLILVVVLWTAWRVNANVEGAKAASKANTALLQRYKPCQPGDPPDSPQCERAKAASDAIDAIQAQHNAQDIKVDELLGQVNALLARPASAAPPPTIRRSAPTRPGGSTPTTAAPRPAPATTAPPTTTTTCVKNPAGKCRG